MSVQLFKDYLAKNNLDIKILEVTKTTKTAAEAAVVHGVPVGSIVKSLLLKAGEEFVLYLTPGDIRLDLVAVATELGVAGVRMATADEVKNVTGYSIGGVPPFGHKIKIKTVIHANFTDEYPLYAAAGSAYANFETTLSQLKLLVS